MNHVITWLILPAIVGIAFQIVVWVTDNYSSPVLPFFSIVIVLWAITMLEFWKRKEKCKF